ncbi:DUF3800 domain-containing protein [Rhizobium sp. RM]|uniref:DUF3800 domain-containing protein n=1 Tax=Rhizobium sp. RM TaxID=2748079 RepID=UPI00110F374E|nr:DUF3800 domain-containing protein [Rhizobium sp. RM]NWJ27658.1 DUF3800 domain-containing protein [Rhizobium sp. RM]TMV18925.1 DUF3800 domain-containing protein [Rhizobium sp. Td3]
MTNLFFLDESGNTGDLVKAGAELAFGDQSTFVLVAVGVDDEAELAAELSRLRAVHKIQGSELKSKRLVGKPRVASDVARYLHNRGLPVFVEVVDKRFFICATMVNHFVIPFVSQEFDGRRDVMEMKNNVAEYLHALAPLSVLQSYINACSAPSISATRSAFTEISLWLEVEAASDSNAEFILKFVRDTIDEFEHGARSPDGEVNLYLPDPDLSKASNPFWMLPNLSSLTNIYGRINLFRQRKMADVTLVHDEQLEFGHILQSGKATMEELAQAGKDWSVRDADYRVIERAEMRFLRSEQSAGIQAADVLAGFIMRFVQQMQRSKVPAREFTDAYRAFADFTNPGRGTGVNYVLPTRMVNLLNLFWL